MTLNNDMKNNFLDLTIHQKCMENRELHYWYGGEVLSLSSEEHTLVLTAVGDVCAEYTYIDEDGDEQTIIVKDKSNSGQFYHELSNFISSDEELTNLIANQYEDLENNKYPRIKIDNNNWWEVQLFSKGFVHHSEMLCCNKYSEALQTMINEFDDIVDSLHIQYS